MVKWILKQLFVVNTELSAGLPTLLQVLPKDLHSLYHDYYRSGTGIRIHCILLFFFFLYGVFHPRAVVRYFFKFILLLTILLYPIGENLTILRTQVPLNILSLPIPSLSSRVYILVLALGIGIIFWNMSSFIRKHCNRTVLFLFVLNFMVLLLSVSLPLWSGEVWSML